MVTHEFTVFADGHVDGEAAARCGDRKSHTLHFVLAQGLTASAAKLLLWPAGATTPTQYEQVLAEADAVSFTPTTWEGVGMTTAQLELLNSAGDVSWQSRRFSIPVEAGAPDETLPPLVDISDATATPEEVTAGLTYYADGEKKTGTRPNTRVSKRGWEDIPIQSMRTQTGGHYFQRVGDDRLWVVIPQHLMTGTTLTVLITATGEIAGDLTVVNGMSSTHIPTGTSKAFPLTIPDNGVTEIHCQWQAVDGTHMKTLKVCVEKARFSSRGVMRVSAVMVGTVTTSSEDVFSRQCENAAYFTCSDALTSPIQVVKLTCSDSKAWAVYRGKRFQADNEDVITIPNVDFSEGFVQIDMIDPYTAWRSPVFITQPCGNSTACGVIFRANCAGAMFEGYTENYDYAASGYDLPDDADVYEDVIQYIDDGLGDYTMWDDKRWTPVDADCIYRDESAGTIQVSLVTQMNNRGIAYEQDDNGDVIAVGDGNEFLATGSLGAGSRWLLFVNGRPMTAPGFAGNISVADGMLIEMVYTCADGIDVGFPFAGERAVY